MQTLIKQAYIIHPQSKHHLSIKDILIEEGVITKIDDQISAPKASIIEGTDICISAGWLDVGVEVCDPGYEHREDIHSTSLAAAAGGFTEIICLPNSSPVVQSKSEVLYLKNNTQNLAINFYPFGAVSANCEGKDLTEMIDMYQAGAVAFSDGLNSIQSNGLMMRALQYVKTFDGIIVNHAHDKSLAYGGQINEGIVSTALGLKGIPHIAEDLMVQRDIYLAEYTDSKIHISNLSTENGVQLVREAKDRGLKVTSSCSVLNIIFNDEVLYDFNTNFKIIPPLRKERDKLALIEGLKDGTIDFLSTNHTPWHKEAKDLEFLYAEFGAIGLESFYGIANKALENILPLEDLIHLISIRNREIFGISIPEIEEGAPANLTIFDKNTEWQFTEKDIFSKSKNSPLIGENLRGKVLGIINKEQVILN